MPKLYTEQTETTAAAPSLNWRQAAPGIGGQITEGYPLFHAYKRGDEWRLSWYDSDRSPANHKTFKRLQDAKEAAQDMAQDKGVRGIPPVAQGLPQGNP